MDFLNETTKGSGVLDVATNGFRSTWNAHFCGQDNLRETYAGQNLETSTDLPFCKPPTILSLEAGREA